MMIKLSSVHSSPHRSAAFRFALMFACVFAGAAFLLLAMVKHQIDHYAHDATQGALRTESAVLQFEDRSKLVLEIARRMRAAPDGNFLYLLLDKGGHPLIGTIPPGFAREGWSGMLVREHIPTPEDPEHPEQLVSLGTRLADGSLLVIATDGYDIGKLGGHMIRLTILWAIMVTLAALLGGWWAGRLFLRRLDAVNAAVERVMSGRLDQRLPTIGFAPELDDLSRNLNLMLDRIDGLMEGLRQVSTDVAHDLRTPLTRLRQRLEAAREEAASDTAGREEIMGAIDGAVAQADQLLGTFRAILRLAQIEGGGRRAPFEPVDLGDLIATLIETYEPVALDAEHQLTAASPLHAMVPGDKELLAQLFANLIENAILHTPKGTRVDVRVATYPDRIAVSVTDDGPGVPETERSRITRRFYQLDASRSKGSAGLGLAVANAIVHLHHASLSIEDACPGLKVIVDFPIGSPVR